MGGRLCFTTCEEPVSSLRFGSHCRGEGGPDSSSPPLGRPGRGMHRTQLAKNPAKTGTFSLQKPAKFGAFSLGMFRFLFVSYCRQNTYYPDSCKSHCKQYQCVTSAPAACPNHRKLHSCQRASAAQTSSSNAQPSSQVVSDDSNTPTKKPNSR